MNTRIMFAVIAVCVLLGAGYFFSQQSEPVPDVPDERIPTMVIYNNEKYNLSFTYPESYELHEIERPGSALRERHAITLIRKEDLPLPAHGEGPPMITINIYQNNLDKQSTKDWIRNTSESNFKLSSGDLASTTIDSEPALSYRWSGLYEGTTVVIARPDWVYAFSVTYLEMGSDIVQDFAALRSSIQFLK